MNLRQQTLTKWHEVKRRANQSNIEQVQYFDFPAIIHIQGINEYWEQLTEKEREQTLTSANNMLKLIKTIESTNKKADEVFDNFIFG